VNPYNTCQEENESSSSTQLISSHLIDIVVDRTEHPMSDGWTPPISTNPSKPISTNFNEANGAQINDQDYSVTEV
jgi:hypothetical protein